MKKIRVATSASWNLIDEVNNELRQCDVIFSTSNEMIRQSKATIGGFGPSSPFFVIMPRAGDMTIETIETICEHLFGEPVDVLSVWRFSDAYTLMHDKYKYGTEEGHNRVRKIVLDNMKNLGLDGESTRSLDY